MSAPNPDYERLRGRCPMGCGETLFIGSGGFITCSYTACPNPSAVSDLLLDHADPWHIVNIGDDSWTIAHPIRERLDGELFECPLHAFMATLDGPPRKPGRYQVHGNAAGPWAWLETHV